MSLTERIAQTAELAKNLVVILGLPALGVYLVKYHNDQIELKDTIIALREAQIEQAQVFSVSSMNDHYVSLKNLYETRLDEASDSIHQKQVQLDSLIRVLDPDDTTQIASYGDRRVITRSMLVRWAANRKLADEFLAECYDENDSLRKVLRR